MNELDSSLGQCQRTYRNQVVSYIIRAAGYNIGLFNTVLT